MPPINKRQKHRATKSQNQNKSNLLFSWPRGIQSLIQDNNAGWITMTTTCTYVVYGRPLNENVCKLSIPSFNTYSRDGETRIPSIIPSDDNVIQLCEIQIKNWRTGKHQCSLWMPPYKRDLKSTLKVCATSKLGSGFFHHSKQNISAVNSNIS